MIYDELSDSVLVVCAQYDILPTEIMVPKFKNMVCKELNDGTDMMEEVVKMWEGDSYDCVAYKILSKETLLEGVNLVRYKRENK